MLDIFNMKSIVMKSLIDFENTVHLILFLNFKVFWVKIISILSNALKMSNLKVGKEIYYKISFHIIAFVRTMKYPLNFTCKLLHYPSEV